MTARLNTQAAEALAALYPEWERFQRVRRRLDPGGRFRNAHLDGVLGRISPL